MKDGDYHSNAEWTTAEVTGGRAEISPKMDC